MLKIIELEKILSLSEGYGYVKSRNLIFSHFFSKVYYYYSGRDLLEVPSGELCNLKPVLNGYHEVTTREKILLINDLYVKTYIQEIRHES